MGKTLQELFYYKTKKSECTFQPNVPPFQKTLCFWEGSQTSAVYPSSKSNVLMK